MSKKKNFAPPTVQIRTAKARAVPKDKRATLIMIEGDDPGFEYKLENEANEFGREGSLRLDDPATSRKHMTIHFEDGAWAIEDLGSTNGTLLNGERLNGQAPLKHGDKIQIGHTTLQFVVEATNAQPSRVYQVDLDDY